MTQYRDAMLTFGDHLIHFAQSVDIVTEEVYYDVIRLIEEYLRNTLNAVFFAVAVEKIVSLQPYLLAEWPRDRPWWEERIRTDQGSYKGQTSFAYAVGKPLWIVGANRSPLNRANAYQDLLSNVSSGEIPRYEEIEPIKARTSIILPLRDRHHRFGIVNIESSEYIEVSQAWQFELQKLADAIAILHLLKSVNILQTHSTEEAKRRLGHGLTQQTFVPVGRRVMFFGSSSRADNEVVGVINDVLNSYKNQFELTAWTDPMAGNIHEKIWEHISQSMYGTCYLSEPSDYVKEHKFGDNPNVLFEAGMLIALLKSKKSPLQGIILIRETDAPDIPFDLTAEFMIQVPRLANGRLNSQTFRTQLNSQISFMLKLSNAN